MTNDPSQKHDDGYRPGSDPPITPIPSALQRKPFSYNINHNSKGHATVPGRAEVRESQIDCASHASPSVNAQSFDPIADVGSNNVNAFPEYISRALSSIQPMTHGNENRMRVDNTIPYLAATNELNCDDTVIAQPAGNQAIPILELEMLPPAHLHNPIRLFADDIALYYLNRAEMGLQIQTERPPSRITMQRGDFPRVMCIATIVGLGLALVTFVGSIISKTLF